MGPSLGRVPRIGNSPNGTGWIQARPTRASWSARASVTSGRVDGATATTPLAAGRRLPGPGSPEGRPAALARPSTTARDDRAWVPLPSPALMSGGLRTMPCGVPATGAACGPCADAWRICAPSMTDTSWALRRCIAPVSTRSTGLDPSVASHGGGRPGPLDDLRPASGRAVYPPGAWMHESGSLSRHAPVVRHASVVRHGAPECPPPTGPRPGARVRAG